MDPLTADSPQQPFHLLSFELEVVDPTFVFAIGVDHVDRTEIAEYLVIWMLMDL